MYVSVFIYFIYYKTAMPQAFKIFKQTVVNAVNNQANNTFFYNTLLTQKKNLLNLLPINLLLYTYLPNLFKLRKLEQNICI